MKKVNNLKKEDVFPQHKKQQELVKRYYDLLEKLNNVVTELNTDYGFNINL